MGNLVFGSAERPGNSTDAAELPIVRDNDVANGQGARPTERPEKSTAATRHNDTQRGAAAEENTEEGVRAERLPKHDSANVLVPETPDGAIRLRKPLFCVVPETPELTPSFASPDSAYVRRPVDTDDTELKTPAITEYQTPSEVTNVLDTGNAEWTLAPKNKERGSVSTPASSPKTRRQSRKSRSIDQTRERSKSIGTLKEPRKLLHWAEIEDVLAPTNVEGSSDTELELDRNKPNSRRAGLSRKPKTLTRAESFSSSSSDDETSIRSLSRSTS